MLAGPAMMRGSGPDTLNALANETRAPVVFMESPRGINDPSLGAFAEVLAEADMIFLLGKKMDYSVGFGGPPGIGSACRFLQVDADQHVLEQTLRVTDDPDRLVAAHLADPLASAQRLLESASGRRWPASEWSDEVASAIAYRPAEWPDIESSGGPLHAVEVCGAVQSFLDADKDAVFISDGGEFGQWAQACISAPHRIINGMGGSIGSAVPFALAARLAHPRSRIVTFLGDGTFGFHPAEFDTAVRYRLPFMAVVGNDATWNAEYQIQLREYGEERAVDCELLPTRYDRVTSAFGGYGEHVADADDMRPALERAWESGLPACVNVSLRRIAAPVVRRESPVSAAARGASTGH